MLLNQLKRVSPVFLYTVASLGLLLLAWTWQLPMIMFDHFDLVPVLQRHEAGDLPFWRLIQWHGGHSHAAAYLVLLVTTRLSNGWLMADIFSSWVFLLMYSGLMCLCIRHVAGRYDKGQGNALLILTILMTLTTLHLPNLIWGWQVAIFINLTGVALGVCAVCMRFALVTRLVVGGVGIVLAVSSFATGVVLLPAMLLGLLLRDQVSSSTKIVMAVLWTGLLLWLLFRLHFMSAGINTGDPQIAGILHYAVNYLGGGVIRFATVLSIPVFLFGAYLLIHALVRLHRDSPTAAALWSMIAAFSVGVALLTGYGRFEMFDANQAWVIRYGSFACLFWFAVLGAVLSLGNLKNQSRWIRYGFRTLVFMFAFNSLHFVPQVRDFSDDAKLLEKAVIETWPEVAPEVLHKLYPTDPAVAVTGLQYLHDKSWAPFEEKQ